MWETEVCAATGCWLWVIPLAMMAVCIILMVAGRRLGWASGCMGMRHDAHNHPDAHNHESSIKIAKRRYASGEIGREEYQSLVKELGIND